MHFSFSPHNEFNSVTKSVINYKSREAKDVCGDTGPRSARHSYRIYHDQMMRGEIPPRLIVFECLNISLDLCGGQKDRFKGIAMAFFLALSTNRALVINIELPMRVEQMLYPNNIAWNLTSADDDLDLFGETNLFVSTRWIWEELQQSVALTNFSTLLPVLQDYIKTNSKYKYPHIHVERKKQPLKILSTDTPIVRVTGIHNLDVNKAQVFWQFIEKQNKKNVIQSHPMVHEVLLQVKKGTDMGCVLKYLFVPSVSVMTRLHATAVDLTLQFEQKKATENLAVKHSESMGVGEVQDAMLKFTRKYYNDWNAIPAELQTYSVENKFRTLLMTLNSIYGYKLKSINHIACIHYRLGGNHSGYVDSETRGYPEVVPQFKNIIPKHMKNKVGNYDPDKTVVIYLSDSASTRGVLRDLLEDFTYVSPSFWNSHGGVVHMDKTETPDPHNVVEVFSEILLLGMCDSFILNKSGFGKLGQELNFRPQKTVRSKLIHKTNRDGYKLVIQN